MRRGSCSLHRLLPLSSNDRAAPCSSLPSSCSSCCRKSSALCCGPHASSVINASALQARHHNPRCTHIAAPVQPRRERAAGPHLPAPRQHGAPHAGERTALGRMHEKGAANAFAGTREAVAPTLPHQRFAVPSGSTPVHHGCLLPVPCPCSCKSSPPCPACPQCPTYPPFWQLGAPSLLPWKRQQQGRCSRSSLDCLWVTLLRRRRWQQPLQSQEGQLMMLWHKT